MNIFISSLDFKTRKEDLLELFSQYGEVSNARIIFNKETHRSKGYGFVEMSDEEQGNNAINALNGTQYKGRTINVEKATSTAQPKKTE